MTMNYHYTKAADMAQISVEKKARAILRHHPNLDEFIMAMGGWVFTRKDKDNSGCSMVIHACMTDKVPKYMKGLQNFIDEWDGVLRMTGYPMRFTAEGDIKKDW